MHNGCQREPVRAAGRLLDARARTKSCKPMHYLKLRTSVRQNSPRDAASDMWNSTRHRFLTALSSAMSLHTLVLQEL